MNTLTLLTFVILNLRSGTGVCSIIPLYNVYPENIFNEALTKDNGVKVGDKHILNIHYVNDTRLILDSLGGLHKICYCEWQISVTNMVWKSRNDDQMGTRKEGCAIDWKWSHSNKQRINRESRQIPIFRYMVPRGHRSIYKN